MTKRHYVHLEYEAGIALVEDESNESARRYYVEEYDPQNDWYTAPVPAWDGGCGRSAYVGSKPFTRAITLKSAREKFRRTVRESEAY